MKYTKVSLGCHADGSFGHEHVRSTLADMVERLGLDELATELRSEMSDDASEELDAIDALNNVCADGISFGFLDGDLMLLTDEQWEQSE